MNIFFRKLRQSPVFAIVLCVLLAVSSAATTVGAAGLADAAEQEANIDENYKTVAIPKDENSIYWRMAESPYCIGEDSRLLISARVKGGKAMSTGALNPVHYSSKNESFSYSMSVLAVECLSVSDMRPARRDSWDDMLDYTAQCRIISYVSAIDAYDLPPYEDKITIASNIRNSDGSIPFTPGKTYLVRGDYHDYHIKNISVSEDFDFERDYEQVRNRFYRRSMDSYAYFNQSPVGSGSDYPFTGYMEIYPHWRTKLHINDRETYDFFWTESPGEWPFFTEYEGDWQTFLESDRGAVWREKILPYMELNHESVKVILSDSIDTMYYFNSGEATILDGRKFNKNEYKDGAQVCMVSASYARLNDLAVGDKINLDFYRTSYYVAEAENISNRTARHKAIYTYPIDEDGRIGVQGDYEIVGIYAAPEWNPGTHSIHADTILVPKASVPGAETGTEMFLPVLHSMILENGSIEKTEAYMAEHGHADEYFYFDQGYDGALEAIATMKSNGQRLMLIGAASLALVGLLFLWLYDRRTAKIARNMRLLGVKKSEVWAQDMKAIFLLEFIAVALGTIAAAVIASADILTAVIQFAALALISGVWTLGTVNRNLMRRK